MEKGDYIQYNLTGEDFQSQSEFKYPDCYYDDQRNLKIKKFWAKMMRKDFAFDFAKKKQIKFLPICWTNFPKDLSEKLQDKRLSPQIIDEIQKDMFYADLS